MTDRVLVKGNCVDSLMEESLSW